MFVCDFCGSEYATLNGIDYSDEGFFCDECDAFTYFENHHDRHFLKLFLEENNTKTKEQDCNIKFNKRLSPLRYPGGKSKLLPLFYQTINKNKAKVFVEPFAGGCGVGLALLEEKIIDHYIINDFDYGIYALFSVIKDNPELLISKIKSHTPTHEDFYKAKSKIKSNYQNCRLIDAAWSLLIANRLSYSGIVKANPLGGKTGAYEDLLSRWNTNDLIKRITKIHSLSDQITVTNQNALEVIEHYYWKPQTTIFIDPPYYKKGKQLYTHYFNETQHRELSELLFSLSTGFPGADIILTYDNEDYIKDLYWWTPTQNIHSHYSI